MTKVMDDSEREFPFKLFQLTIWTFDQNLDSSSCPGRSKITFRSGKVIQSASPIPSFLAKEHHTITAVTATERLRLLRVIMGMVDTYIAMAGICNCERVNFGPAEPP